MLHVINITSCTYLMVVCGGWCVVCGVGRLVDVYVCECTFVRTGGSVSVYMCPVIAVAE